MTDDTVEAVARALCLNRGGPACDCRERGVDCQALRESLLCDSNPFLYQARAAIRAMSQWRRVEDIPEQWKDGRDLLARMRHGAYHEETFWNAELECWSSAASDHDPEFLQPLPAPPDECDHEWIDATNQVIQGGEICLKCNAVRATKAEE